MKEKISYIIAGIIVYFIISFAMSYFIFSFIKWDYVFLGTIFGTIADYFIVRKIKKYLSKKNKI